MKVGDLVNYRHHGVGIVLDFFRRPGRNQMYTYINCYWFSLGVKTSLVLNEAIRSSVISQRRRNHVSRQD